jgi:thiamine biosynthesis lipoprotein
MGTTYSVKVAKAPDGLNKDALASRIDAVLSAVDARMSTYRVDSELSAINAAGAGERVAVSADTAKVVDAALAAATLTGGAFDPTIGPLVDLWGFGPKGARQSAPSTESITAALGSVGHRKVAVEGGEIAKAASDVHLDLSGVAKGYGVDKVAELLESQGVANYLVEVGGELRAKGRADEDRAWRVGIEKPNLAGGDFQRVIDLDGDALATSGNYRIFFEADGKRYAHIIDPRTGRPLDHKLASATVVAASTMEADALSTSMLALGPEAGMALATEHGIAAFFIVGENGDFTEAASPAFAKRFSA